MPIRVSVNNAYHIVLLILTHPVSIVVRCLELKNLQNLSAKNGNVAQKNVHIFKNNAPALLKLSVGH